MAVHAKGEGTWTYQRHKAKDTSSVTGSMTFGSNIVNQQNSIKLSKKMPSSLSTRVCV